MAARFGGERGASEVVDSPPHEAETPADTPPAEAAPTAAVMITATAVAWWVLALATSRPVLPNQIPSQAWIPLIGVGIVSTAIALQTFYAGARRIGAAQASLVSTVEPIYTIVLASILFGEVLTPLQLVGGAMVIIGVVIAQTATARSE
jgi:drug/metabolite transporter (DMT)-like permease